MSHLYTQWGAEAAPRIMAIVDGKYCRIFGWEDDSLGEKYVRFVRLFLTALTDFLDKKGYDESRCFFHISDEPNRNHIGRYGQIRKIVKPILGKYKIFDALSDYEYYSQGIVDNAIVVTESAEPFLKNQVKDLWVYYCCGQGADWLSNRFLSMPLQRTRILGIQLYMTGCKGFLHWGYNYYNSALSERYIDPYEVTDADGSFQSGDSFIVYPAKDGKPLDSVRHEALFDAFQDFRALSLLEEKIGREKTLRFLKENGVKENFTDYPKSALWHSGLRKKINRLIVS